MPLFLYVWRIEFTADDLSGELIFRALKKALTEIKKMDTSFPPATLIPFFKTP